MTATLTGNIRVTDLADLSYVHVAKYQNGTRAWVDSEQAEYVLLKTSPFASNGSMYVAPAVGAPIAGNASACWARLVEVGGLAVGATVAQWQAAIDAAHAAWVADPDGQAQTITLVAGVYTLSAQLTWRSGVWLQGQGRTKTLLRWTGAAGDPNDPLNCMISARGATNGKMVTTPTNVANAGAVYYPPGAQAVSVANAGTIGVEDWFVFRGQNDPATPEYGTSPGLGLRWSDVLQVQSISGGGLTLHTFQYTASYHTLTKGAGAGPQISCESIDVVENFGFEDLTFDGQNIADVIFMEFATQAYVRRCGFQNVSHECVDTRTGRDVFVEDNYIDGAVNGFVMSDATHAGTIERTKCTETGLREAPAGKIWGAITLINDSADWRIESNEFVKLGGGLFNFGSRNLRHVHNTYRDFDATELKMRNTAFAGPYVLGVVGVGVHMGVVDLSVAYFNQGFIDIGTICINTVSPSDADASYWWHDTFWCNISALTLANHGKSPYQNLDGLTRYMNGLRTQDSEGQIVGFHSTGCEYAFRHNSSLGVTISEIVLRAAPSNGTLPVIGMYFENGVAQEIRAVHTIETWSWYFAGTFTGENSQTVVTGLIFNDQWFMGTSRIGRNRTGGVRPGGDVVAFDKSVLTGERALVATNNANAAGLAAVVNNVGGFGAPIDSWTLCMPLPGHGLVACDATAFGVGEDLKAVGGGAFTLSPVGAGAKAGQAMSPKGAVAGTVQISPSP
jgi:hypothetical protein